MPKLCDQVAPAASERGNDAVTVRAVSVAVTEHLPSTAACSGKTVARKYCWSMPNQCIGPLHGPMSGALLQPSPQPLPEGGRARCIVSPTRQATADWLPT